MGNACCQDVQKDNSLMISDLPQKNEYYEAEWPSEDNYIRNYLEEKSTSSLT